MYNLIMWGSSDVWTGAPATIDMTRFLEYTNDALRERLSDLSDEVARELKSIPTLFAYEFSSSEPARVGFITDIQRRYQELRVSYKFDESVPPIATEKLEALSRELDIAHKFERSRSHWAVKEVDLYGVLRYAGIISDETSVARRAFSRQTILMACDLLKKKLNHSEFDRLLLEIGLDHISAGRDLGGLQARSVALAKYTIDHMNELTADGESLSLVVVRRAAQSDPHYDADYVDDPVRNGFWSSLQRDGFALEGGEILKVDNNAGSQIASRELQAVSGTAPGSIQMNSARRPKVFIVHGWDDAMKYHVAHFLKKIEVDEVILHERPNGGRTIITKFEEESSDIEFAVVLMSPDDAGGPRGDAQKPRARQNVIFELGFFIGKLGAKRVCALVKDDIERPSDFDGVVYIPYDSGEAWQRLLARELKHAGVTFDAQKLL